jgi:hypothetical protein
VSGQSLTVRLSTKSRAGLTAEHGFHKPVVLVRVQPPAHAGVAQPGRATASSAGGSGFDSLHELHDPGGSDDTSDGDRERPGHARWWLDRVGRKVRTPHSTPVIEATVKRRAARKKRCVQEVHRLTQHKEGGAAGTRVKESREVPVSMPAHQRRRSRPSLP